MLWNSSAIAAWGFWKKDSLSRWSCFGPTIFSVVCSCAALVLYPFISTIWSAVAMLVTAILQAFVIVQLAFMNPDHD